MIAIKKRENKYQIPSRILNWLNLRPEEGERTLLMFAVFTVTSMGMLWVEQISIALFLHSFGAKSLPVIYICSAIMGSGLGFIYSWLQRNFPIKKVLLTVVLIMSLPLLLFRLGLGGESLPGFIGLLTVFLLRLWIDAQEILNDLNIQCTSNKLFNIREIKRTYPVISGGILVADMIAGFCLPILLFIISLKNILIVAFMMMLLGGFLLKKITNIYEKSFSSNPFKKAPQLEKKIILQGRRNTPINYIIPLFIFFFIGKALYFLIEFYYLGQLEIKFNTNEIVVFLSLFTGILGVLKLITQWFVSSRIVKKISIFISAIFLPIFVSIIGILTIILPPQIFGLSPIESLFFSAILIKFIDDLFDYTLIGGVKPYLFQPLAANIRDSVQNLVQRVAEPLATAITGVIILAIIYLLDRVITTENQENFYRFQGLIFLIIIVLFSLIWVVTSWYLRFNYINLLVREAEKGRLGFSSVDLMTFKRAIVEVLNSKKTDTDKSFCLEWLAKIDPVNATEIIAPKLLEFSPSLQKQILELMLRYFNPKCLLPVQKLIYSTPPSHILALSLRYVWLSQNEFDFAILKPYLDEDIESNLRSTAATLILQKGDHEEKKYAITTVEKMLNSTDQNEKILAIETLKDGAESFVIKGYLPHLLKEKNSLIRAALFELIAEHKLSRYYFLILQGLSDKLLRKSSEKALVSLNEEAIPLLSEFTEDKNQSDLTRLQAFNCLSKIGSPQIYYILSQKLISSWGNTRRNLLRIILRISNEENLDILMEHLGQSTIEILIDQELLMLGQIYAAKMDLKLELIPLRETELLRDSLDGMQIDIVERCFLLMKLLYPRSTIEATLLSLNSDNQFSINLGLELLDNGIDLPQKSLFLQLLAKGLSIKMEQLQAITSIISYQPMTPYQRLLRLLTLRHFLSDWCLACCFHLARQLQWEIPSQVTNIGLRNPNGFVREAVLSYIKETNPALCLQIISGMEKESNPLVSALIRQIKLDLK